MKYFGVNNRSFHRPPMRSISRGISLVELMVAVVISLMTVLAIASLITNQVRQQRLGGSINNAQTNASVALSMIVKELQQAGLGLSGNSLQNCNRLFTSIQTSPSGAASVLSNFETQAVSVVDGSGNVPDTLRIRYAESVRGAQPISLTDNMSNAIDNIPISSSSSYSIRINDVLMLTNSANDCTLAQVSSITAGSPPTSTLLITDPVSSPSESTANFNLNSLPSGAWETVTYTTALSAHVITLGQLTQLTYSINTGTWVLQMQRQGSVNNAAAPTVEQVVDLQAQYGVSTSASSDAVTEWVSATGATWAAPSTANRKRIKAIRISVVTRTGERDPSKPTAVGNITLWPLATTGQLSAAQHYTVTAGEAQEHRYRVLRAVVPLKNMLLSELL